MSKIPDLSFNQSFTVYYFHLMMEDANEDKKYQGRQFSLLHREN